MAHGSDDRLEPTLIFCWFVSATFGCVGAAFQASRVATLYAAPAGARFPAGFAALLGISVGMLWARRTSKLGAGDGTNPAPAAWALLATGVAVGAGSLLAFLAFPRPHGPAAACIALGVMIATTLAAMIESFRSVGRAAIAFGFFRFVLRPLVLVVGIGLLFGGAAVANHVGFLRSAALFATLLLGTSSLAPAMHSRLHPALPGAASRSRVAYRAATVGAVLGLFAVAGVANRVVSAAEASRFPDEIVFTRDGDAHRFVVVAAPGGYELYSDASLRVASLDEGRRAAALVRPALATIVRAVHPARVLLLHGGTGTVERELLADARVRELVVVADDRELVRLAREMPWLASRARGAFDAPKLRLVFAEPAVFLVEHPERFDVVLDDLPAPLGYGEGKYHSRYYFGLLAAHVAEGGALAAPVVSAFGAPEAFASSVRTMESTGLVVTPYHAAVPTLGVASFVVGTHDRRAPVEATPGVALDLGLDLRPEREAPVSTLGDQRIVVLFRAAREGHATRGDAPLDD